MTYDFFSDVNESNNDSAVYLDTSAIRHYKNFMMYTYYNEPKDSFISSINTEFKNHELNIGTIHDVKTGKSLLLMVMLEERRSNLANFLIDNAEKLNLNLNIISQKDGNTSLHRIAAISDLTTPLQNCNYSKFDFTIKNIDSDNKNELDDPVSFAIKKGNLKTAAFLLNKWLENKTSCSEKEMECLNSIKSKINTLKDKNNFTSQLEKIDLLTSKQTCQPKV